MDNKLKRIKTEIARAVDLREYKNNFRGERVYARIESDEKMSARGMKEGIEKFSEKYRKHGKILRQFIQEERAKRETRIYFGVNKRCRLTAEDYLTVMERLGFTESVAERLYPDLMEVSRILSKKRDEERSVLIG